MVAAAVIGGAVVGAGASAYSSKSAAATQSRAAEKAGDSALQQFYTINDQQSPYRGAGYSALSEIQNRLGMPANTPQMTRENFDSQAYLAAHPELQGAGGQAVWDTSNKDYYDHWVANGSNQGDFAGNAAYQSQLKQGANSPGFGSFAHEFNANDLNANLAPNYQFMLDQGIGQNKNLANSVGGLVSGNAMQGINTFAQNYAKNAYQDAFNNYTTNQNNIYSRLSNLAGLGQTSLQQSGAAGMAATDSYNNYMTSAAAANAAGKVGQGNAISSLANTASKAYMYGAA